MKSLKLNNGKPTERAIVVFLGWGMDEKPFITLRRNGYDIFLIWDYRELWIDWSVLQGYKEICIIAWSMGVYASSVTTQSLEPRVTLRLAINGSPEPVSANFGIPPETYFATRDALDGRRLEKFYRRMFATRSEWENFRANMPSRGVEELKDELTAIYENTLFGTEPINRWDVALVGDNDRIFPPANVWRSFPKSIRRSSEDGHFIDLQKIINKYVIDKHTAGERFLKKRELYNANAPVQAEIRRNVIGKFIERVIKGNSGGLTGPFLEIGGGEQSMFLQLRGLTPNVRMVVMDLAVPYEAYGAIDWREGDAENEISSFASDGFQAILSASTIQWFNSPAKFFRRAARVLHRGGMMIISSFVKGNIFEAEMATGYGLPLPTFQEWISMAEEDFEVLDAETYRSEMSFGSPVEAMRHLSSTGVNSLGSPSPAETRRALEKFMPRLDSRFYLTYKPMIMVLKKK